MNVYINTRTLLSIFKTSLIAYKKLDKKRILTGICNQHKEKHDTNLMSHNKQ